MTGRSRVVLASVLLAAALAALLGGWFVSGWADVRAKQADVGGEPERAAKRRAQQLARELGGELQQLANREAQRAYYEYSNLFHHPKAGGNNVMPSPLSKGTGEPLVLGYFQVDPAGRVSTPTINDDIPELSEAQNLAAHQAFRTEVARVLAPVLRDKRELVAEAKPQLGNQQAQVLNIDQSTYEQNFSANDIYVQQNARAPVPQAKRPDDATIPIYHSAIELRTIGFAGRPTIVASRHVELPRGTIVQGFVIDRAALTSELAARAGETVAELRTDDGDAPELAPGLRVIVTPGPSAVAEAAADAAKIARDFLLRFVVIGALAALAFGLVVMLVARAEQLARERSKFAAAAAHELRTPLAGLQLYGDMLADGLGDPGKLRDYARRMSEEASRLGRVVSNVLGFSQLERGNLSVDAGPGDLAGVLRELADRAQPALDRAGAVLALDVAPELRARFDRDALARVVGNLLDNAEKYSREADDRTIELAARQAGDRVELVVTDHGPGVAQPARLFRAFSRGVTSDGPAGLGLGLALSRSLAQAMGGELDYRPAPGGGAQFTLRLLPA